jgi:hypothetical protein
MSVSKITIRSAHREDLSTLRRLAALDSSPAPAGAVLVAEVDGEIVAAVEAAGGRAIADPFRPTADVVALLQVHAGARSHTQSHRTRRPRRSFRALPRLA